MTSSKTRALTRITSLLAGGEALNSTSRIAVSENPARPDEPVGEYVVAEPAIAEHAVSASVEAFQDWRRRSPLARAAVLRHVAHLLHERKDDLAAVLTAENGKTLGESRREIERGADTFAYFGAAAWQPSGDTYWADSATELVRTLRVPVGVIAVITPWNYPVSIPCWKIAPALLYGNTVVWKPATPTPIVSIRLAEILHEAGVPRGVLQVILGGGALGEALVQDERVAAVTFTGSNNVGRRIAATVCLRNAKCQLELGGHNPAIVLADADMGVTVKALVRAIANGAGQKCTATRRIIVHEEVRDELVEKLCVGLAALRIGDGADPTTDVGPLINESARDEVAGEIERALAEGCIALSQPNPIPEKGAFLSPTLLGASDQSPTICREEVFGPVAVVIPAGSPVEALQLAADTRFGLSAALYTKSERWARIAAEELNVGVLNVNRPSSDSALHVPFGGMKESTAPGPPEQGQSARDFYTELKSVFSTVVS